MIPPGFTIESTPATTSTRIPMVTPLPQHDDDDALAHKKLLESTSVSMSFSAMSGLPPNPLVLQEENKYAAFRGLYVVESCTETRHVKYAMEIASPELQLHARITKRFSAFYVMRKRLLQSLKKCQDPAARPTLLSSERSNFSDLDFAPWRPCCRGCRDARKTLKTTPFPRRAFLFTTVDDVDARAPLLEDFLSKCVRLVSEWPGCARGRKFACVVLGQFLGLNLLFHVFQQMRLTMAEAASSSDMDIAVETMGEKVQVLMVPQESQEPQEPLPQQEPELSAL